MNTFFFPFPIASGDLLKAVPPKKDLHDRNH